MPNNSKSLSDQEIEKTLGLGETPESNVPQHVRFDPPDFDGSLDHAKLVPSNSRIASATIRRHGIKGAPLCFGSPSLFEPTESDCCECRFRDRCGQQAELQAARLIPGRTLPTPYPGHVLVGANPEHAQLRHCIRERYLIQANRSRSKYLVADREYRRERRARADIAPIEREFRARLSALKQAVASSLHDKTLQQLRGRETQVAKAWKAGQLARLCHGSVVSDAIVACTYRTIARGAVAYTRNQARSDRQLIAKLENIEHVWGAFKKSAP